MENRKTSVISGMLMFPLAVGRQAVVLSHGRFTLTPPITAIYSRSAESIRFETADARYILLLDPLPHPAGSLPVPGVAA